eukprot:4752250-Pleurochrysis_carterae.AAC.1
MAASDADSTMRSHTSGVFAARARSGSGLVKIASQGIREVIRSDRASRVSLYGNQCIFCVVARWRATGR